MSFFVSKIKSIFGSPAAEKAGSVAVEKSRSIARERLSVILGKWQYPWMVLFFMWMVRNGKIVYFFTFWLL